jgi:hypothetical protein
MLNLFRKKSVRHKRYKQLFESFDRYVLTHQSDVIVLSCIN